MSLPLMALLFILPRSEQRSIQIPIQDSTLLFSVTIGGKDFSLHVNTNIAEILLVDEQCGHQSSNCPRYCRDSKFLLIFCPLKCQPYSPQSKSTICPKENRFSGLRSASAQHIPGDWRRRFPGTRMISGQRWAEQLRYSMTILRKRKWDYPYRLLNITLISTDFADQRLLPDADGLLGLGAGRGSTAEVLLNSPGIQNRLISVSLYRLRELIRLHVRPEGSHALTIGGLDGVRCADWTFVPSVLGSAWVVEAEEAEFFGVKIHDRIMINFDVNTLLTLIPAAVAEQLVHEGILVQYGRLDNLAYYILPRKCDKTELIRLQVSGVWLDLRKVLLAQDIPLQDRCYVNLAVDESSPHYKRSVMTVGLAVFTEWCLGFDYGKGMVGFGRRRLKIAYPLLPDIWMGF